jgi:hypothetical protein
VREGGAEAIAEEPQLLAIYLNDHLAGASGVLELARRSAGSNRGTAYGRFLEELCAEIAEDRVSLRHMMRTLGVGEDRLKLAGAWAVEKAGRLKLNGRLLGYSPYSRVLEFEMLRLGVQGKLALWRALQALAPIESRLDLPALEVLSERAERQALEIEEHRLAAVSEAFTPQVG